MEILILMLIIIVGLLIFNFNLYNRDFFEPEVLFLAGFTLAIIAAMMNVKEWDINLSFKTFSIIIIGNLSFLLSGLLFHQTHKKNASNIPEELSYIRIPLWKTIVVVVFGVLTVFMFYKEIVRLSQYADPYWQAFGMMVAYKKAITYGPGSLNNFVNQMAKVVYCFGYIYAFIFVNNLFCKKNRRIRDNIQYIFPLVMFVIMTILRGNRTDFIALVVLVLFLYSYFWHRTIGWQKQISGALLKKISIVFVVGLVLFYNVKGLVGRVSTLNFLDYITQYIGGSIQLLDMYVKEPLTNSSSFLGESLTGLIQGLNKIGLTDVAIRKQLEFRYTNTHIQLGNVYTAFRRYYNDLSYFGLIIFPGVLSWFMNSFYYKVKKIKGFSINKCFKIIVYSSLVYVLPFQAMEDSFFINKVTIGYAIELLILYCCIYFIFVKVKVRR